jgi:hypothetical protein
MRRVCIRKGVWEKGRVEIRRKGDEEEARGLYFVGGHIMGVLGNCNSVKVRECIACCGGTAMDLAPAE